MNMYEEFLRVTAKEPEEESAEGDNLYQQFLKSWNPEGSEGTQVGMTPLEGSVPQEKVSVPGNPSVLGQVAGTAKAIGAGIVGGAGDTADMAGKAADLAGRLHPAVPRLPYSDAADVASKPAMDFRDRSLDNLANEGVNPVAIGFAETTGEILGPPQKTASAGAIGLAALGKKGLDDASGLIFGEKAMGKLTTGQYFKSLFKRGGVAGKAAADAVGDLISSKNVVLNRMDETKKSYKAAQKTAKDDATRKVADIMVSAYVEGKAKLADVPKHAREYAVAFKQDIGMAYEKYTNALSHISQTGDAGATRELFELNWFLDTVPQKPRANANVLAARKVGDETLLVTSDDVAGISDYMSRTHGRFDPKRDIGKFLDEVEQRRTGLNLRAFDREINTNKNAKRVLESGTFQAVAADIAAAHPSLTPEQVTREVQKLAATNNTFLDDVGNLGSVNSTRLSKSIKDQHNASVGARLAAGELGTSASDDYMKTFSAVYMRASSMELSNRLRQIALDKDWTGTGPRLSGTPLDPGNVNSGSPLTQVNVMDEGYSDKFTVPQAIADALDEMTTDPVTNYEWYQSLTGAAKAASTHLSVGGSIRNFGGSGWMYSMSDMAAPVRNLLNVVGYGRGKLMPLEGLRTMKKSFEANGLRPLGQEDLILEKAKGVAVNSDEYFDQLNKAAIKYRVVDDGAKSGEYKEFARAASQQFEGIGEAGLAGTVKEGLSKTSKFTGAMYQAGDDVFKVGKWVDEINYLTEVWSKSGKLGKEGFTQEDLYREAADTVRDVLPSLSMTPKIVSKLRKSVLFGPFPTFPAESLRIHAGIMRRGLKEVKGGIDLGGEAGKMMVAKGSSRILSMATSIVAPRAASRLAKGAANKYLDGQEIPPEAEERMRPLVYEWVEGSRSEVIKMDKKTGDFYVVDASFVDAQDTLIKGIYTGLSMMDNGDGDGAIQEALEYAFNDLVGLEMIPQDIILALMNQKSVAGDSVSPLTDAKRFSQEWFKATGKEIGKTVTPRTARDLWKIAQSAKRDDGNLPFEMMTMGGVKVVRYNAAKAAQQLAYDFRDEREALLKPLKDYSKRSDYNQQIFAEKKAQAQARFEELTAKYHGDLTDALWFTEGGRKHEKAFVNAMSNRKQISASVAESLLAGETWEIWTDANQEAYRERATVASDPYAPQPREKRKKASRSKARSKVKRKRY